MTRSAAIERPTATSRDLVAGCFVCWGSDARWRGGNAQGVAARHHDSTGHATWCDVALSIRYGRTAADDRQIDIEESIATLNASSGDAPECAALTEFDASAVPAADVSVPVGRSSNHALSAAKPEMPAP